MSEFRQNIYARPYLTAGEGNTSNTLDEIVDIVERVGCCTFGQLVDYINAYHAATPKMHTTHYFGPQEVYGMLNKIRSRVHIVEPGDVTIAKAKRLVYSTRYNNKMQIHKNEERYGIAKMATIIPFLPHSRAVYDVASPLSFVFLTGNMQIEVAVIASGHETTTCAVLDRMKVPKSVDRSKLLRIAIVKDERAAANIIGGGFESVCIINEENKLQQVRTIEKSYAWDDI